MRATRHSAMVHGVIGGLLAGAIVAVWFLVADLFAGDPLRTPARLGAVLFGRPDASAGGLVGLYSLVHFGAFAMVGGASGWLLGSTGVAPGVFLGGFLGLCVLTAIHYVGLVISGVVLINVLPWAHVMGANVLAGVAFMSYMHRAEREEHPIGPAVLRHHPVIAEGLKVGLLGAVVVATWFLLIDVATGTPLLTPAALGSAVFFGAADPSALSTAPGIVLAYTILHVALFSVVGIFFVVVARGIETFPRFAYLTLMCAILLEALTFAVLVSIGESMLGSISLWSIGVANVLAIGVMAGWLWRTRPLLREHVLAEGFASTP